MISRLLLALIIATMSACASLETNTDRSRIADLKQASKQGDPHASRDLAIAILMQGQKVGTFEQGLELAQLAHRSGVPGSTVLYARLLEANLSATKAFKTYLAIASRDNQPPIFRAQALHRLRSLMDDSRIDTKAVEALLNIARTPGLIGELSALAAEQGAMRVSSEPLLHASRKALGVVTSYRASSRLSSLAALPIKSPRGPTQETEMAIPLGEPIKSVDGYLSLGEHGSGVYQIEIDLANHETDRELRIENVEQLIVELNDLELARFNRLEHSGSRIVRIPLETGAAGRLRLWIGSRAPDPRVRASIRPGRTDTPGPARPDELERLAKLDLAMQDQDVFQAVEIAGTFVHLPPIASIALSRLLALDPGFSIGQQARRGQETLRAGLELAPDAKEIRRELVSQLLSLGDVDVAAAILRQMEKAPLALRLMLAQETQDSRAGRELSAELVSRVPTSCSAHLAYMASHEDRLRFDRTDWHRRVPWCGPTQLRAAEILKSTWRNQDAAALLRSHIARYSRGIERARAILVLAQTYRALGQVGSAERVSRDGLGEGILVKDFLEEIARLRILAKDSASAAKLNAQLVRRGGTELDVAQLRFDPNVDLGLPLSDGLALARQAIERRKKAIQEGRPQPSIRTLLKERHTRVLNDGSMVHREHRLVELLDDGAIERFGEIPLPDESVVMLARTYKLTPSGVLQPIEPEQIREKTSLSLPALSPGSIIEAAWLWYSPAEDASERYWHMPAFNFDDLHGPVVESRLILRTPKGSTPKTNIYGRSPRRETLGVNLVRYTLTGVRRAREEKLNPRQDLHRNAVLASSDTNFEELRNLLRDRLTEKRRVLPSVKQWVQEQIGEVTDPEAQLRILYKSVIDHVLDSDVNIFASSVADTLQHRTGNRSLVLRTACDLIGVTCGLVLLEPRYAEDASGKELPRATRFFYPVIHAELPTGDVWLDPNRTHAPFGYIVPLARGAQGLVLEANEATFRRSPTKVAEDGKRTIKCEGSIVDDRSARIDCVESLTGHEAMDRRAKLSDRGATYRTRFVGVFAKRIFPLSRIHSVAVEGVETPEKPLRISWSADVSLSRESDHEFIIRMGLSPTLLTRRTVVIPSRTTPLFTTRQFDIDFHLRLQAEGLYRFTQATRADTVDHDMLQLERDITVSATRKRLDVRKRFHLDVGRILPQDYPRWVDTARKVDTLERLRITIER